MISLACLRKSDSIDSLIALIPKVNSPEGPNDYQPISLLKSSLKFRMKFLANRFQDKISELIHVNKNGFLKTHSGLHRLDV